MRFLALILFLAPFASASGEGIIISTGTSIPGYNNHTMLGEWKNHSAQYSVRYEGTHYGIRADHSVNGDDDGNTYLTGDSLWRPTKWLVAGAGIMVDRRPLRAVGSRMNFHAMVGLESSSGIGVWFDHWSNGHIHAMFGPDNVLNPPRNVLSVGLVFH
jgi:hypothetical protein